MVQEESSFLLARSYRAIYLCQRTPTAAFLELTDRYYDSSIENKHTRVAGTDAKLGFGQCALPLILEHNTPNNSIALIWADTPGERGVNMQ